MGWVEERERKRKKERETATSRSLNHCRCYFRSSVSAVRRFGGAWAVRCWDASTDTRPRPWSTGYKREPGRTPANQRSKTNQEKRLGLRYRGEPWHKQSIQWTSTELQIQYTIIGQFIASTILCTCSHETCFRGSLHQLTSLTESLKALESHGCQPWVANLSIVPRTLGTREKKFL